ncbi:MAG: hypothetical protein ACQKBY_09845 [Verrucomicrobiales bacterium]
MNELAQQGETQPKMNTGLSVFDSGTFEQMGMIAKRMAASSLIPETLRAEKKGGVMTPLPIEQVEANCFRIVEQSQRWGFSPFAVVDHASVVYGKLMWEGKLVHSVIQTLSGVNLNYEYSGSGESRKVVVSGTLPGEDKPRTVEGDVKGWKTDQWKGTDYDQRLAYRGAREWGRRHNPAVMLGVYVEDEFDSREMRQATGRDVTPRTETINPFAGQQGDRAQAGSVSTAEEPAQPERESEGGAVSTPTPENSGSSPLRPAFVVEVDVKSGNKEDGGKWTAYFVKLSNGEKTITATTFSNRIGKRAQSAVDADVMVELEKTDRGYTLVDLQKAQEGGLI